MDDMNELPFEEIPADAPSAVPFSIAISEMTRSFVALVQVYTAALEDGDEFIQEETVKMIKVVTARTCFELTPMPGERLEGVMVH